MSKHNLGCLMIVHSTNRKDAYVLLVFLFLDWVLLIEISKECFFLILILWVDICSHDYVNFGGFRRMRWFKNFQIVIVIVQISLQTLSQVHGESSSLIC